MLTVVSAGSLLLYIYAVLATVHHTVDRESYQSLGASLTAEVSELEFKDIALKNKVNLDVALASGFIEVSHPLYVSRSRPSLTFAASH